MPRRFHPGSLFAPAALSLATVAAFLAALSATGEATTTRADAAAGLSLQLVADGFGRPSGLAFPHDGSGRMMVLEQKGRILVHDGGAEPAVSTTPFLDLTDRTPCVGDDPCGERGLLGLAFHPRYADNGLFFVYYVNVDGDSVLARYAAGPDPDVADPASEQILLTIPQVAGRHFGGHLAFGPDGYLYVTLGDNDDPVHAQDLSSLQGSVLRIDVDSPEATYGHRGPGYAVPPDNPFIGDPTARGEIWAFGFRNPWRFSFDRTTGDLFLGDVGETLQEEIDLLPGGVGGLNLGWDRMEGSLCNEPPKGCDDGTLTHPILDYSHASGGCAVIGGYRYRGLRNPLLRGTYLYSDYCLRTVFGARPDGGGGWTTEPLLDTGFITVSSFGEDPHGELYVTRHSLQGEIYRIVDAERALFADGFESGDLARWSAALP